MAEEPLFFELSWSILSTIGAANVFFGILVVSVTNLSPIAAVPIVTSAAGAVANGLCFYAFYLTSPPATNRAVASGFADIMWLIQEAGLSFYGYVILSRILRDRNWYIFASVFWIFIVAIAVVRIIIAVTRVRQIVTGDEGLQQTVNHLHMAYFPMIAVVECVSAYYLLTIFAKAQMGSFKQATKTGLFPYLMRSTEVRLALLAVIGTMRAVTYSFQTEAQSATNLAGQVDRFAYTMECLFPIVMYIDMLSSKVVHTSQRQYSVSPQQARSYGKRRSAMGGGLGGAKDHDDGAMSFPTHSQTEHIVEVHGGRSAAASRHRRRASSEERIFGGGAESSGMAHSEVELDAMEPSGRAPGISKTVEFEVEMSEPRTTEPRPPPSAYNV
ncbi:hypothetical protein C8A03DRAFT_47020 [Achaetomium macrosporum]|uniref:Uncharacterized protein n=1 Tax=Achaetomium macrosporum TaxID=79813 RepID=A0AAN7C3H8_9PEZI|nr:hypothetical protein C8A03DRAFT_47020 [Achaetomium macrosporum]